MSAAAAADDERNTGLDLGETTMLTSVDRGPTEYIISYFTLMSSEIHYYDIIEKMGSWTLMSSGV